MFSFPALMACFGVLATLSVLVAMGFVHFQSITDYASKSGRRGFLMLLVDIVMFNITIYQSAAMWKWETNTTTIVIGLAFMVQILICAAAGEMHFQRYTNKAYK